MTELTGTGTLVRFVVRRDRMRILIWVLSITVLDYLSAASTKGIYATQTDLDEAAQSMHGNAAAIALNGPDLALNTMGGQVAFQIGTFSLVMVGLMSMFMVGHTTRVEEETGRLEMIRAMAVGRHAATAAALTVATCMNVMVGGLVTCSLLALDLPVTGSVLFGVALCALGLTFAGITLVAVQLSENTRVAYGVTGAILGAAFVLQAAGDISDGTLSWLSPIGWSQKTRPYAGDRWWPLLIEVAVAAVLVATGALLSTRRDVDAGFVRPRAGRRAATPGLGWPLGLALRLQRGGLIGWSTGMFVAGAAFGWIANDVDDFIGDNETMRKVFTESGVNIVDSYLAVELFMVALAAMGFAVQSALRLRTEETALRAEPVLATPVSRVRWAASHLVIALAGCVVVLAAGGLGSGLTYGGAIGDLSQVPRMMGAALVYAPALWVLVGFATLMFGLVPRGVGIAWAAAAACLVIGYLGEVLNLPTWTKDFSPFQHTPQLPGADLALVPLGVLTAIAAALTYGGMLGFRHRDVG